MEFWKTVTAVIVGLTLYHLALVIARHYLIREMHRRAVMKQREQHPHQEQYDAKG